jgi:hypothetical protein
MALLLVTIGAVKIAVLRDNKGKALDVHFDLKKKKDVKKKDFKCI